MKSSDGGGGTAPHALRAVVAGHADFAAGLISAVQQISGAGHLFHGLSNAGFDAAGLDAALRAAVIGTGAIAVFTDLPAGSCTIAARRLARELPALAVVTGANLPMLLDFALKGGEAVTAPARAAAKGRDGISVAHAQPAPEGGRAD